VNAFESLLSKVVSVSVEFATGVVEMLWPDLNEEHKVETKPERTYDRRLFLKIKLKNLRDEVNLIRSYEKRLKLHMECWHEHSPAAVHARVMIKQMQEHRRQDIREEARATLLAYGYIRGRRYDQIEQKPRHEYHLAVKKRVERVAKMVNKYSVCDGTMWSQEKMESIIRGWMGVDSFGNSLQVAKTDATLA
jgi:hypothetical protein